MRGLRWAGGVAVLAGAAALVGCSNEPDLVEVTGTVSFEGAPIEDGAIRFYPADGKNPAGGTIKDGKYTATKVPVGVSKVVISGAKVVSKKKIYNTPNSPEMPVTAELLPDKYSKTEKTGLTYEVKRGSNEKNWELTK
ncbi:hypothetical protein J8F10_33750 [Gemmata sp. G18]|uniref:Carboxypeptidase regulatory-like domain-containing protein n=1 Tax=Gemmata palustris TaxID=2822762 RepID=A0ABS5C2K9_9BACT|nr:hypothetical protein [Gemmata palustris]MBP3960219.1 hypothetical protein [Gemmata palustris]